MLPACSAGRLHSVPSDTQRWPSQDPFQLLLTQESPLILFFGTPSASEAECLLSLDVKP